MDQLLGLQFTSTWWALLYLMVLCVAATVFDRVINRMVSKVLSGTPAKAVRFVLMAAVCAGVLLGMDALLDGVQQVWWSLAGLALVAAALMVLPAESAKPVEDENKAEE